MLETCRVMQNPMTATQEPQLPDWELYIQVSQICLPCSLLSQAPSYCSLLVLYISLLYLKADCWYWSLHERCLE